MKITSLLVFLPVLLLSACSTTTTRITKTTRTDDPPETVMVTYLVKSGKAFDLEAVLTRAWEIYRKEHLVMDQPHVIVQSQDADGTRVTEIFTWVSHSAPEHAPASVKDIWSQMQPLCESRNGHAGLGGGEVKLLVPARR